MLSELRKKTTLGEDGYSFVELLVVSAILIILASAAMPLTKVVVQRQREVDLRRSLRDIRVAIDRFKDAADQGVISAAQLEPGSEGYPPDLEALVDGLPLANDDASGKTLKLLRRIPLDPMTKSYEWGLRSYQDRLDSETWGGQNVFDIYTKSDLMGLDGTRYRDW